MTSTDIVRIIKACKESGIEKVEYQGLSLVFKTESVQAVENWHTHVPNTMNLVDNPSELTHNENIEDGEDDDFDELIKLSDPLEWERRQVND